MAADAPLLAPAEQQPQPTVARAPDARDAPDAPVTTRLDPQAVDDSYRKRYAEARNPSPPGTLAMMGGLRLPGAHNQMVLDRMPGIAKYQDADTYQRQPTMFERIVRDVGAAMLNGEIATAPVASVAVGLAELGAAVGVVDRQEADKMRFLAEGATGTTGTGATLLGGAKYAAAAVPGVMAGASVAGAVGAGAFGTGLLMWLGTVGTDFATGALMERPDDQATIAHFLVGMAEQNPDSETWKALQPVFAYLAADPGDSELQKRLLRGTQEALTNVFGEAAFVAMRTLPWISRVISGGGGGKIIEGLDAIGQTARHQAFDMAMEYPQLADALLSGRPGAVSEDLAIRVGAAHLATSLRVIRDKTLMEKRATEKGAVATTEKAPPAAADSLASDSGVRVTIGDGTAKGTAAFDIKAAQQQDQGNVKPL